MSLNFLSQISWQFQGVLFRFRKQNRQNNYLWRTLPSMFIKKVILLP